MNTTDKKTMDEKPMNSKDTKKCCHGQGMASDDKHASCHRKSDKDMDKR